MGGIGAAGDTQERVKVSVREAIWVDYATRPTVLNCGYEPESHACLRDRE